LEKDLQKPAVIHVQELSKQYDSTLALDRLSLEVPAGAVFGLLGPNGAGKTTFLRLVMGFVFPDAGQIDRGDVRPASIGYLPERAFYPSRFTVRQYLDTLGRLAGLQGRALQHGVNRLLEQLSLDDAATKRLGACSRGMLQRVGLAQALLADPPLLLLDEPAQGLDPAGQKFMRDQILALHQAGRTVILSSHHLDEVARICTHVGVLNHGRLVRSGPLETILAPRPQVTITLGPLPADLSARLAALDPRIGLADQHITLDGEIVSHKANVLRLLLDAGVDIRQLCEQYATLEDVYLEATGE
jgi:ABC-2 type transport system ATP-binding protein